MEYDREYIEEAFKEPVRRERLKYVLGCKTDRQAREIVSQLQDLGYNIINMQDGTGYKLATEQEALAYGRQELSRAMKILIKALKMMRKFTLRDGIRLFVRAFRRAEGKEIENQMCLEDIL